MDSQSTGEPTAPNAPAAPAARPGSPLKRLLGLLCLGLIVGIALRWLTAPADIATAPLTLTILTEPTDATVMVDGAILGRSPIPTAELTPGLHSLRVEKEGFETLIVPLTVTPDSGAKVFQLAPVEFARLDIQSTPAGAQVYVDGEFRGVSPLTVNRLKPGIHDLLVEKANFGSHQSKYTLRPGELRRVTDIALENKLLSMLQANLEIDPRSIGNHLDLAHFYYINNDMHTSVKYYMRARELANLPMAPAPEGTPPEDIAFSQQLFQDEIRRVKTEEDHHYQNYREYYGNDLDFDTFRREYAQGVEDFNKWAAGIQDLAWVADHAQAELAADHPQRAAELFSDYVLRTTDSGVALAGETAALLAAGKTAEVPALYAKALAALKLDNAAETELRLRPAAWRWLGQAWRDRALKTVGAGQQPALDKAEECLAQAVKLSTDKFDLALAQFAAAELADDRRQPDLYATRLRDAYATIQAHAAEMKGNPEAYAPRRALQWRAQYRMAFLELGAGDKTKATALLREIAQAADEKLPVKAAAKHALEFLDSGKTPTIDPQ